LITAKDHAAIQISVADVDANGVAQNTSTSFAISGPVRAMGESDDSINRLATQAGRKSLHSGVIRPDFSYLVLWNCCWDFFEFSAQARLVVSKVDIGSCPLRYFLVVRILFSHSEFRVCDDMRCGQALGGSPRELLERSSLDLPRSNCAQPPAYNLDHLAMGGGNPPTSLADSIISTISVSLVLLLSG
jgi:hypothetical protein